MVSKPDGNIRFCWDFNELNEVTIMEYKPLPRIEDNLGAFSGPEWIRVSDMKSGSWQCGTDKSRRKTAFSLQGGQQSQRSETCIWPGQ